MSRNGEKKCDIPSVTQLQQKEEVVKITDIHDTSKNTLPQGPREPHLSSSTESTIGIITAMGRSVIYRFTSFYLRTPVKLFRPPRFDIYHYVREEMYDNKTNKNKKLYHRSSLYILKQALHRYGWKIIPRTVVPPIFVNSLTGMVLYSTYIHAIPNKPAQDITWFEYFKSGCIAGLTQAIVTTPIDAVYVRSHTSAILSHDHISGKNNKITNLWIYGWDKWKQLGIIGCYAGFNLTALKEMIGFGCYFSIFEMMKLKLSRDLNYKWGDNYNNNNNNNNINKIEQMKNKKWRQSFITFVSGITAAFTLQCIQFPISKVQKLHYQRLEILDLLTLSQTIPPSTTNPYRQLLSVSHIYWHSYVHTLKYIKRKHCSTGILELISWLYRGFVKNTVAIIPSTTAGLMVLDYMRRKLEPV